MLCSRQASGILGILEDRGGRDERNSTVGFGYPVATALAPTLALTAYNATPWRIAIALRCSVVLIAESLAELNSPYLNYRTEKNGAARFTSRRCRVWDGQESGVVMSESVASADRWIEIARENAEAAADRLGIYFDPMAYVDVAPGQIEYHCKFHMGTRRTRGSKLFDWGRIESGDWDLALSSKLSTQPLRGSLKLHFIDGVPWEDTPVWKHKLDVLAKRGKIDGCASAEDLAERYRKLDLLFEQVRKDGRLKAAEERGAPLTDDLFVSIGRDGRLLFGVGGSHRLAIAQILGFSSIPVRVLMRHEEYARLARAT